MEKDKTQYITFSEFVNHSGRKENTVKKKIGSGNGIPGIEKRDNTYFVLSGTRYPCDLHRYKLKNSSERRYVLLKTISEYKYISHLDLRIEYRQFQEMLSDLLAAKLIKPNHLFNNYGANAYDCTYKGDNLIKMKTIEAKEELIKLVAETTGTFVGSVISKIYEPIAS